MGNSQAKRREEASDLKAGLLHRTGAADARAQGRGQDNGAGLPGGGEPQDGGTVNGSGTVTDPSVGAQEGEPMLKDERYGKDDCEEPLPPLLPILEDYMIEMLPAYATVAFSGLTMFNLMVASNVAQVAKPGIVQSLLYMCPYTYIPFGVGSMILATVATKCRRFAGAAAGFLLAQLLYILMLGGFTTVIRLQSSFTFKTKDIHKDKGSQAALGLTIALCSMVLVAWSLLLPYPKWFCLWSYIRPENSKGVAAALACSAQSSEAASVALRAAKGAVEAAKVANSDAKAAKKAADAVVAAEGAKDRAVGCKRDAEEAASEAKQAAKEADECAVVAEKAADEAGERCNRARVACENVEKLLENARVFEDKAKILSDPINKV